MYFKNYILTFSLLILSLSRTANGQQVYEKNTFVSYPAGKHVNHSFYSTWNVYFAVEDGVLVYDHHKRQWLEPITSSDGLSQYPVLLVWQNATTQDVWIVTPDYVFVYDELAQWMSRLPLPVDPLFSGTYELGISDSHVIIASNSPDNNVQYSALFFKTSGTFDKWAANSELDVDWENVEWIRPLSPELNDLYETLPVQTVLNGSFDGDGNIHLDGHPRNSLGTVSSLIGDSRAGDTFLSTYGMGIFHQKILGGDFYSLPFGLLSPDVMSMDLIKNKLIVGGRAGLTFMDSTAFEYDEAITDIAYDYSFVADIETSGNTIYIIGRGGVFRRSINTSGWERVLSKDDLGGDRIYGVAAGSGGNVMVATQRNAYLFHESGMILRTLFPEGLEWPVFDISFKDGRYYISSFYGLYIYDEESLSFIGRVNSSGELLSIAENAAADPIYESVLVGNTLWASSHRGIVELDLLTEKGKFYLSPNTPFKPRGLVATGKRIWIGTDIGLHSMDSKSGSWRHYTMSDGLISDFVTDLIVKDGYIWVGTNLGLTRIKWKNLY